MCLGRDRRRRNRPVRGTCPLARCSDPSRGRGWGGRTSPSNLRILKLRLLILSDGEPGKQFRQFPKEVMRSRNTCAMVTAELAQDLKLGGKLGYRTKLSSTL